MKYFYSLFFSVFVFTLSAHAQTATLQGTITDEDNKPVEYVSVSIKNTKISTHTNSEGIYKLENIAGGDITILFSRVGYKKQEVKTTVAAAGTTGLNLTMRIAGVMDEVAITGYVKRDNTIERIQDVEGTYITAGTKSTIINLATTNANIAEKTGRQVFAKVPGVFVYDMDGSGNQMNVSNRGLDPHRSWEYNIRQNGIITNSDMYGYPASHYNAPMESYQSIEMLSGSSALQYGAQFGGMINYVTKKPDTSKAISIENLTTAGGYGLFSNYTALGGKAGNFIYYGYISKRVSGGYRENAESDVDGHFASLTYLASNNLSIKAEVGHSNYLYHIPGPLNDSMFNADPQQSTRDRNYFSPDMYVPSLQVNWSISPKTFLQFTQSGVFGSRSSVQFIGFATKPDIIDTITNDYTKRQVDIDNFNSNTTELRIRQEYNIGKIKSFITGGIQYMHNDLQRRQQGKGTTGFDYDLSLTVPGWGRDMHYKTQNIALFAQNIFYFTPKFSVAPGLRYENGTSEMSGTISYYDGNKLPVNIKHSFPLFGLSTQYKLNEKTRIYASASQAYRPVVFREIVPANATEQIDPDLEDAFGYTAEAGIGGSIKYMFKYELTFFHILYENRIGGVVLTDTAGNAYQYKTNIGTSVTDGVEIFAEVNLLPKNEKTSLSIFTSTALFDARYTKGSVVVSGVNVDISGNELEAVPDVITRNGINFVYTIFSATLQQSYVGKTFSDAFNTTEPTADGSKGPVPAYNLIDFNTSVVWRNYTFRFGVNNITDQHYFTKRPTFYPDPGIWPSDGRTITGTIGFKF
ncbi:MAG: TonB-dependent receptor [Fimbriimonadaceae bacterium]|nr:TonB-dependent receptor [Chitinophagales bacterium]